MSEERKLATVRKIIAINPIEGADSIEACTVDGWVVVAKKGNFKVGELVVYCELDSWIPFEMAPFLCKGKEPREYNGVKGERLRSIRLRGQLSQGLILPLDVVGPREMVADIQEGEDVTVFLNVQKYEKPLSAQLSGVAKGNFPSWIPRSDQERIQNLTKEFAQYKEQGLRFEVTEKCEGSSMTIYINQGEFGVCSRNLDLLETADNTFWKVARELNLEHHMRNFGGNFAIQGELIGPKVEGNIYNLDKHEFRVYDMWNIDTKEYMNPHLKFNLSRMLGLQQCPVLGYHMSLLDTMAEMLQWADGKSAVGSKPDREGLVFKCMSDPSISFKCISNNYLVNSK